jgi:hypothetical protein
MGLNRTKVTLKSLTSHSALILVAFPIAFSSSFHALSAGSSQQSTSPTLPCTSSSNHALADPKSDGLMFA